MGKFLRFLAILFMGAFICLQPANISTAHASWTGISCPVKSRSKGGDFRKSFNTILNTYVAASGGCWFCPLFKTVFDTVNTMGTEVYNQMRDIFLALITIGGLAWLLFKVGKFMVTLHGAGIGEFMTDLFKGLGSIMLIAIALKAPPAEITGVVIDIPVAIGTNLAIDIMNTSSGTPGTVTQKSLCPPTSTVSGICQRPNPGPYEGKALSAETFYNMDCLMRRMSLELVTGMALGTTIFMYSLTAGLFGVLPDVDLAIIGLLIIVCYFIMLIILAFKLVDLLLKLGFLVILFPLFITCLATPVTRGYAQKAAKMFVGCMITLITLSLFLSFSVLLMAAAFVSGT